MANLANEDKVTKKDLLDLEERLTKKLVIKEEFDRKVTELATKEELSDVRTELLEKLATREAVDVLANQVLKNTNDIEEIKFDVKGIKIEVSQLREDMNDKFDTVLNAVDKVSRQLEEQRTEKVAIDHALIRQDAKIDNHETRISKLERQAV